MVCTLHIDDGYFLWREDNMLDSVMNKSTLVMDFNASIHKVGIESFF